MQARAERDKWKDRWFRQAKFANRVLGMLDPAKRRKMLDSIPVFKGGKDA